MQHSCLSMQFWYSVYGCCCADQSAICLLHDPIFLLNFTVEWPDLELVGRWTKYVASKIRGLKHPRFWDADGNGKWTFRVLGIGKLYYCLPGGEKYLVMWMPLCEGKLKVKTAHFRLLSSSQKGSCLIKPPDPIARGVPVVPNVPQWWWIVAPLGKHLRTTQRPQFVAWQSNCWRLQKEVACIVIGFELVCIISYM